VHHYHIQQRIRTPSQLFRAFSTREYTLRPFEDDNQYKAADDWIAIRELDGEDWKSAYRVFCRDLAPILDAASVVSQCSVSPILRSYSVYRDHPKQCALVFVSRANDPVGMHIDQEEWPDVLRLLDSPAQPSLRYIRLANNNPQAESRLFLMLIASEALAGTEQTDVICPDCSRRLYSYNRTNRTKLKAVLGEELYSLFYERDGGALRHKLAHGGILSNDEIRSVVPLYDRMRDYLKREYGLESLGKITDGPRIDGSSFSGTWVFMQCTGPVKLNEVDDLLWEHLKSHNSDKVTLVLPGPEDY
jgi:hypothetical protein